MYNYCYGCVNFRWYVWLSVVVRLCSSTSLTKTHSPKRHWSTHTIFKLHLMTNWQFYTSPCCLRVGVARLLLNKLYTLISIHLFREHCCQKMSTELNSSSAAVIKDDLGAISVAFLEKLCVGCFVRGMYSKKTECKMLKLTNEIKPAFPLFSDTIVVF